MIPYEDPSQELQQQREREYANALMKNYLETSELNMDLIIRASIGGSFSSEDQEKVLADSHKINEAINKFEKEAWYEGGWQEDELNTRTASHELELEDMEALSLATAGRTLITLRDKKLNADITVITSEDEPQRPDGSGSMGLQSIHATAEDAIQLLHRMIEYRKAHISMTTSTKLYISMSGVPNEQISEIVDSNSPHPQLNPQRRELTSG